MARFDGKLVGQEVAGDDAAIAALIAAHARERAIARYLACHSGWDEALKELGGAFAPAAAKAREG